MWVFISFPLREAEMRATWKHSWTLTKRKAKEAKQKYRQNNCIAMGRILRNAESSPLFVLRSRRTSCSCRTAFGQLVVGARCGWDLRAMGQKENEAGGGGTGGTEGTVLPVPIPWPELSPFHMAHGIGGGGGCDPGNARGIDTH